MEPFEEAANNNSNSNANSGQRGGVTSSHKPAKKLESFREAKQYSDSHFEEVAQVEEFTSLDASPRPVVTTKEVATNTGPVRPITLSRTASTGSAGSDLSAEAEKVASLSRAQDIASQFDSFLHRDTTESRLNRDLLVSPLCAFDDCASLESGWSLKSAGSRRSATSHGKHHKSHVTHHHKGEKPKHYTSATSSYLAKQILR
jgi:hypothetical protein